MNLRVRSLLAGLCALALSSGAQASIHADIDNQKLLTFLLVVLVIAVIVFALVLRLLMSLAKKGRDLFAKPGSIRRP